MNKIIGDVPETKHLIHHEQLLNSDYYMNISKRDERKLKRKGLNIDSLRIVSFNVKRFHR